MAVKVEKKRQDVTAEVDQLLASMEFDLKQVTWGYQDIFRRIITELYQARLLSTADHAVTRSFFEVLSHVDKSIFDSVIKTYLDALQGDYGWVMRLPRLFERWSQTGLNLAREHSFLGMKFFQHSAEGRLGTRPAEVELLLDLTELVKAEKVELLSSLLDGYAYLNEHLPPDEIREFVLDSISLSWRNMQTAGQYLAVNLTSAHQRIEKMTKQVRVSKKKEVLERLGQSLLGHEIGVNNLAGLDSDELIIRGSNFISCSSCIYLPEVMDFFPEQQHNSDALKVLVVVAAAAELSESFALVHGAVGAETASDLFRTQIQNRALTALFVGIEIYRVLTFCQRKFPGVKSCLNSLIEADFANSKVGTLIDQSLQMLLAMNRRNTAPLVEVLASFIEDVALGAVNFRQTAQRVIERADQLPAEVLDSLEEEYPQPHIFFPDMLFPLNFDVLPDAVQQLDLRTARPKQNEKDDSEEKLRNVTRPQNSRTDNEKSASGEGRTSDEYRNAPQIGFFYDEWNQNSGDYYRDWCCVHEQRTSPGHIQKDIPPELKQYADRVRRIFERIKPEAVRQERRLLEGDSIHLDHFMEYISRGGRAGDTEMRFYNKPLTSKRDIAVAILLDLSGSTGAGCDDQQADKPNDYTSLKKNHKAMGKNVLDVEKEAAYILSSGLDALGDKFGLFGFTGSGRENCLFLTLKDFNESWNHLKAEDLMKVSPGSSTRIGPALRHTAAKLCEQTAKSKMLLLITDGKPCDQGYDTESHYAHYDVRKAGQESRQFGIQTFCISTSENSPSDMEIMFPRGHYVILDDISKLPQTISKLYLKVTHSKDVVL